MYLKQINGIVLGALMLFTGSAIPAQAASVPGLEQMVINHTAIRLQSAFMDLDHLTAVLAERLFLNPLGLGPRLLATGIRR